MNTIIPTQFNAFSQNNETALILNKADEAIKKAKAVIQKRRLTSSSADAISADAISPVITTLPSSPSKKTFTGTRVALCAITGTAITTATVTAIVYPKEAHQLIKNAMEGMPTKEEAFETAKALIALIPSKEQALEMLKSLGEQAEPYKKQALEMVSSWIAQLPSKEQAIALGSSFSKELLEGAKKVACSTAGQLFFGSAVGSAAIQRTKKKVADANDKKEQATESIVANATSRTNSTRCLLLGGVVSSLMLNHRAIEAAVEKAPSLIEKAASIEVSSGTKFFALATAGNICFTLFRKKYTLNPNPSVKSSE